jgi:FAD/FMN-containing dehydrogenase
MLRLCAAVLEAPLRPISLVAARVDPPQAGCEWLVSVHLGGRREVLADECATLAKRWPACHVDEGPEARVEAALLRDKSFAAADGPVLRVETGPRMFAHALEIAESALDDGRVAPALQPRWWCEPGLARIEVALRPSGHEPALLARTLSKLRGALAACGGRARLLHAPAELPIDPSGEPPAGLALMRRLREKLDPDGVFASGRFLEAR